jgi:predicted DNA-binding antitoxin AbrB/MazE fold protein
MEYIIKLFDVSKYIKPATPLYIAKVKNDLLQKKNKKNIFFENTSLNPSIYESLHLTAQVLNNYIRSSSFDETIYTNAQNELIYLCSREVLNKLSSDSVSNKMLFKISNDNIYRILGMQIKKSQDGKNIDEQTILDAGELQNMLDNSNKQTLVEIVDGDVCIYNDGLLKLTQIASLSEGTRISLSFSGINWDEEVSFIDFYIDLNGISEMGGSSFLPGVNGFIVANSGWDYALRIYQNKAILYKYSVNGASIIYNLDVNDNSVTIPHSYIRGNPAKWGFQAIVVLESMGQKTIVDFFNQSSKTKDEILSIEPFQVTLVGH